MEMIQDLLVYLLVVFRQIAEFYKFIFVACYFSEIIVSRFFVVGLTGFLKNIIRFDNKDNLNFTFLISVTLISFYRLIAQAIISSNALKRSADSGQPCIIPVFNGNCFEFFLNLE